MQLGAFASTRLAAGTMLASTRFSPRSLFLFPTLLSVWADSFSQDARANCNPRSEHIARWRLCFFQKMLQLQQRRRMEPEWPPDGGFSLSKRMVQLQNIPELSATFRVGLEHVGTKIIEAPWPPVQWRLIWPVIPNQFILESRPVVCGMTWMSVDDPKITELLLHGGRNFRKRSFLFSSCTRLLSKWSFCY